MLLSVQHMIYGDSLHVVGCRREQMLLSVQHMIYGDSLHVVGCMGGANVVSEGIYAQLK